MGITPSKTAPSSPADPLPIHQHRVHTPIRSQAFARFLSHHPDRAFVSKLTNLLTFSFDIGYFGSHTPLVTQNLHSALEHPEVIDKALRKELASNCMAAPPPPPTLLYAAPVLEQYQRKTAAGDLLITYQLPPEIV